MCSAAVEYLSAVILLHLTIRRVGGGVDFRVREAVRDVLLVPLEPLPTLEDPLLASCQLLSCILLFAN